MTGSTTVRFPRVAKNWLRFHARLAVAPALVHPYEKEITDFSDFLRSPNLASHATIDAFDCGTTQRYRGLEFDIAVSCARYV